MRAKINISYYFCIDGNLRGRDSGDASDAESARRGDWLIIPWLKRDREHFELYQTCRNCDSVGEEERIGIHQDIRDITMNITMAKDDRVLFQ